jgi:DNA-binding NarL/FixJ family response regulator
MRKRKRALAHHPVVYKELKPAIVLMDINMPVMNGIAAATEIRRIAPSTKIVFLTVHDVRGSGLGPARGRVGSFPNPKPVHI